MSKIYVTNKRDKALHLALTLDDYMYEKYKRQQEQLHRDAKKLIHDRKKVFRVVKRHKDYDEVLQIIDVQMTDNGSIVYVQ